MSKCTLFVKSRIPQKYGQIVPTSCGIILHASRASQVPYNAKKSSLGRYRLYLIISSLSPVRALCWDNCLQFGNHVLKRTPHAWELKIEQSDLSFSCGVLISAMALTGIAVPWKCQGTDSYSNCKQANRLSSLR